LVVITLIHRQFCWVPELATKKELKLLRRQTTKIDLELCA
jgi:hypothetical protein